MENIKYSMEDDKISVVLNLYKRPQNLTLQLNAILNQTVKPCEILLYQDGTSDTVKIPDDILDKFTLIKINEENEGVWERFRFANEKAQGDYVCVFDDDTIPGKKWLENCLSNIKEKEGLYGTIGIVLKDRMYCNKSYYRVGWAKPNDNILRVDFVGHSWFFKKEWLDFLFQGTDEFQKMKYCAEDMCFSYALQLHNIPTYVPPHPQNDIELWGSLPKFASSLGNDENGLFVSNGWERMTEAFDILLNKYKFKILRDFDKNSYKKVVALHKKRSLWKRLFS